MINNGRKLSRVWIISQASSSCDAFNWMINASWSLKRSLIESNSCWRASLWVSNWVILSLQSRELASQFLSFSIHFSSLKVHALPLLANSAYFSLRFPRKVSFSLCLIYNFCNNASILCCWVALALHVCCALFWINKGCCSVCASGDLVWIWYLFTRDRMSSDTELLIRIRYN